MSSLQRQRVAGNRRTGRASALRGVLVLLSALTAVSLGQPYAWRTAEVGGGGFVTGTVFHPAEPGLVYARTDVGGAYRLDTATNRWIALNDDIGGLNNEAQHLGVLTIGLDPNDPDRVYLASGQYGGVESWKLPSRIYRSTDRGNTWTYTTPGFKMAGNGEGRGTGERMAVDPLNGANILVGTSNDGIWRSTNHGATWSKLGGFPLSACNFVLYAPANHNNPGPNRRAYAAANTLTGRSFWYSDDNGTTWGEVPNHPGGTPGFEMMPIQGSFDAAGVFYSTWGDATGPANWASNQGVWKLGADGSTWISIPPPAGQGFFSGISADPRVAGHVVVSTLLRWWPRDEVYQSTDGGATWTPALTSASISTGNSPWSSSLTPHWITDVDIDPFNSGRAIFNTGGGLFQTTNLAASGTARLWTFFNDGLEELVPAALLSPTAGPPLVSVTGDYTGLRHDNLDRSPLRGRHSPGNGTNSRLSGATLAPEKMIRQNSGATYFSTDSAATWATFPSTPPTVSNGHGTAIFAADGGLVLWCPASSPAYVSNNNGATWTSSSGCPPGISLIPVADSVNGQLFYLWNNSGTNLLRSTDGGQTFSSAGTFSSLGNGVFRSVPDHAGHLWVAASGNGLHKSTNSGTSFTKLSNVTAAYRVAFGRAAPGASHPAVFIWGTVAGVTGFFRSDDAGASWVRINDNLHNFGYINDLCGDPRVFGRIFLATSGRGVVVGEMQTIPPVARPTAVVYDDLLHAGWTNASNGAALTSSNPVLGGTRAISVAAGPGNGIRFVTPTRSLTGFQSLSFHVFGGASLPPPALKVAISRGGIPLEAVSITPPQASGWQLVSIPLAELGGADIEDLTALSISAEDNSNAFSMDEIRLSGSENPESPAPVDVTGWTSNIAGKVIVNPATPSSPLLIPDDTADNFSTNTLQANFTPITLSNPGDKLTLTGEFQLTAAGVSGVSNWFRFGLYDNGGQAPGVATNWLGHTGMGNSLYERVSSGPGLFSTGGGAVARTPDALPAPVGSTSPAGNPPLGFTISAVRTTDGIVLTHFIRRTDTLAVLMNYSYTDTSPNNNGLLTGSNTTASGYSPTFNTAGFAFARSYIGSGSANAQFTSIRLTYEPATVQQPQTINFDAPPDQVFGTSPIELTATATSGLPVAFEVISGPATLSGNQLSITGIGVVTVRASQAGNTAFFPATPVDRNFNVAPQSVAISLDGLNATADGTPKAVTATTIPAGVPVNLTYDGSPTPPTLAGSYVVSATVTGANHTGTASGTLVINQAATSFSLTGWTTGTAGRSVSSAETDSPLLNPDSNTQGANSLLQAFFNPITLVHPGDKITLTGSVTLSAAGTSGAQQWFRYGLFDNRGQAATTYTGWLGYTGMAANNMANALMEKTGGTVDYASTNAAGGVWRIPNASPAASGTTAPSVVPTLEFRQTILRTASGVDVTFHLQRVGASVPALTLTWSDSSPNNNGAATGTQDIAATGYNPTYRAAGFLMPTGYIGPSNTARAQFSNIRIEFVPADPPTSHSELELWRDQHFGTYDNSGNAADNFDADSDGETNLLEFATGQNPLSHSLASTGILANRPGHVFQYTRSKAASGEIAFAVEWSETLDPGSWSSYGVAEITPPVHDDGTTETIHVSIPDGPGRRFFRLRITPQP